MTGIQADPNPTLHRRKIRNPGTLLELPVRQRQEWLPDSSKAPGRDTRKSPLKLQINYLKRKAANLGFQIIEPSAA